MGNPGHWEHLRPSGEGAEGDFFPALFEGQGDGVPERGFTCLQVKQAVLALSDPTQTAPENWTASYVITGHLVTALRGQVELQMADHSACLRESRTAVWQQGQQREEEALVATMEGAPVQRVRQLR